MSHPALNHVNLALENAKKQVEAAKEHADPEAHPHLDDVQVKLSEAQERVNRALEQAAARRGGPNVQ
jgi:hypothetical protein